MKNIIIGLVGLLILLIGVFIYVKIKDNDSIDNLNIAVENYSAGTEQLLGELTELRKQLDLYETIILELERANQELTIKLGELENSITSGLSNLDELSRIDTEFEKTIEESLEIIRQLREYGFTE